MLEKTEGQSKMDNPKTLATLAYKAQNKDKMKKTGLEL
jgi:hypothetical protein